MKGNTPYNKYSYRKEDLLKLFHRLNGEVRWKTLKEHLKELKWGPTTLKRVLDEMIKEDILMREARLSERGSEVWYKLVTGARVNGSTVTYMEKLIYDLMTGRNDLKLDKETRKNIELLFKGEIKGNMMFEMSDGKIVGIYIEGKS